MRKLLLENDELFTKFEQSTMRAISTLWLSIKHIEIGADPNAPTSNETTLELLDFMRRSFPEALWSIGEDDGEVAPAVQPRALLGPATPPKPLEHGLFARTIEVLRKRLLP